MKYYSIFIMLFIYNQHIYAQTKSWALGLQLIAPLPLSNEMKTYQSEKLLITKDFCNYFKIKSAIGLGHWGLNDAKPSTSNENSKFYRHNRLEASLSIVFHVPIKKAFHYYLETGMNHSLRLNGYITSIGATGDTKLKNNNDYVKFSFIPLINTGLMWHINPNNLISVGIGSHINVKSLYTFTNNDKMVSNWGVQLSYARNLF